MNKGARLKKLRSQKGITLEEAGKIIGTSKQTLYKYENDIITNIPIDKIEALARLYNVSASYIMGWEEPQIKKIPKELKQILEEEEITLNGLHMSAKDKEKVLKVIELMYSDAQTSQ